jgi:nucleotide-binding universal stress UspA family protein
MHRGYVEHTGQKFRNELEAVGAIKIEIGWEVLCGDPATEITNYAREQNADRIIMSSHGRSGVRRLILGSVADKIARESPVPVVIIRAFGEEAERSDLPDRKILIILDGSITAEQVLPYATQHAEMSGRAVVLLRVCEPPDVDSPFIYHLLHRNYPPTTPLKWEDYVEQQLAKCEKDTNQYLAGVQKRFEEQGIEAQPEVLVGKPAEQIVDYVSKNPFNLIAMTTHGRSGLTRWAFGSVADKVLHATSSPILLVRSH